MVWFLFLFELRQDVQHEFDDEWSNSALLSPLIPSSTEFLWSYASVDAKQSLVMSMIFSCWR
jgi:hypothetical protein